MNNELLLIQRLSPYSVLADLTKVTPRLIWATGPDGVLQSGDTHHPMTEGRIFFLPPGIPAGFTKAPENGWAIFFDSNIWQAFLNRYPEERELPVFKPGSDPLFTGVSLQIAKVFHLIAIVLETEERQQTPYVIRRNYIAILLLHLAAASRLNGSMPVHTPQQVFYGELIRLAEHYYRSHRRPNFYAARLGMSVKSLNALTRQQTGRRLTDLINEKVLAEAGRLLTETHLMIKEIGYELDFSGPEAFTHFFKKHKGIPPARFREQMQKGSGDEGDPNKPQIS